MAENQIATLNHTHQRILDWLILNPDKTLRECADSMGYTQAWLSTVIHSDVFQLQLRQMNAEVHARVCGSVPEKLAALADIGIEKLTDMLAKSEDPVFVANTTDKLLHRMGYAPKATPVVTGTTVNVQNNTFHVSREELTAARQIFLPVNIPVVIEGEPK